VSDDDRPVDLQDLLEVLQSIDGSMKTLVSIAQNRENRMRQAQPSAVASDRDLDGKYGDPVVKFVPRDWTGGDFKGMTFSQCPPELLDMLASSLDWSAGKAEEKDERTDKGKPIAEFRRQDAARARGWAARMRSGKCKVPDAVAAQVDPWA
jgi:hypothetical protein